MDKSGRRKIIETAGSVLPSLLTIALFVLALFVVVLPAFQRNLTEQKKKMITAVIDTVGDVLDFYDQQEKAGRITREEAQTLAIRQIRGLHYGPENKDYFWIHDTNLRMLMHPYRPDMEGKDLSTYADQDGKLLFVEMGEAVRKQGEGYVSYRWQHKDDPHNIVPKLSYVKLFQPWGWVIGTGIYLGDIDQEMTSVRQEIISVSAAIFAVIVLLSFFIIRTNIREITRRRTAEEELLVHKDHLEELVEKRTLELREALSRVKVLSGFLPICSSCKKIRDDQGYWTQIESYIQSHSEADFSHGICPDCAVKLYPEYFGRRGKEQT